MFHDSCSNLSVRPGNAGNQNASGKQNMCRSSQLILLRIPYTSLIPMKSKGKLTVCSRALARVNLGGDDRCLTSPFPFRARNVKVVLLLIFNPLHN
jgi:hypothetical protein